MGYSLLTLRKSALFKAASFCLLGVMGLSGAPIIVYHGDSIVQAKPSNGYCHFAIPYLNKLAPNETHCVGACVDPCYKLPLDNINLKGMTARFEKSILPLKPDIYLFNGGVNNINCIGYASERDRNLRWGELKTVFRAYLRDISNMLPKTLPVHAEHTAVDECSKGGGFCGDCPRQGKYIPILNEHIAALGKTYNMPIVPLYKTSIAHPRTDGRHFTAAGALAIAKASGDFLKPLFDGSASRVYLSQPRFDTTIVAGK